MKISAVTTLYKSEATVVDFLEQLESVLIELSPDFEIVVVDDGSPDKSHMLALEFKETHPRIKVIRLSRNFGHHPALLAGIDHSDGDYVFIIDSDLEEDPRDLKLLLDELKKNTELEMSYGVQSTRRGGKFQQFSGWLYYKTLNALSDYKYVPNQMTSRVLTRKFIDSLSQLNERSFLFFHLLEQVGYKSKAVALTKKNTSKSTYSFSMKFDMVLKSFTLVSTKLLKIVFLISIFFLAFGFLVLLFSLFKWLRSEALPGWTSLLSSIWIIGGFVIFSVGVVGTYIENILFEVKQRPRYIIDRVYD